MTDAQRITLTRAWRIVLAIVGGYVLTLGFMGTLSVALPHVGVPRSEAAIAGLLAGMVFYVAVIVWCAAAPRLRRLTLSVLVASLALHGVANWLALGYR